MDLSDVFSWLLTDSSHTLSGICAPFRRNMISTCFTASNVNIWSFKVICSQFLHCHNFSLCRISYGLWDYVNTQFFVKLSPTSFSICQEMAIRSSICAWKIPWTEEPGGLQSMGSQRVGHNLATSQQCTWRSKLRPVQITSDIVLFFQQHLLISFSVLHLGNY